MKSIFNILFVLIFLLSVQDAHTQVNKDSLKKIWLDASRPDNERMNALYDLAWEGYLFSYPDSCYRYAKQLYTFATKKKNDKQVSNALSTMGASFYVRGNYDSAILYYNKNIELLKKTKNESDLSDALNNLGLLYDAQGNYVKAIEHFNKSQKIKEKLKDYKGVAISLNNIANIYFYQKEYPNALENYRRSIGYYKKLDNKKGMAGTYNNMANVFREMKQSDSALYYQQIGLDIYLKIKDNFGIAGSYNNMGRIYQQVKKYDSAIINYERSISLSQKIDDPQGLANSYNNLGSIYMAFMDAQNTVKIPNEFFFTKALEYCENALIYAKQSGAVLELRNITSNLHQLYKMNGNYEKAYEMLERFYTLRDSINNEENQKAVLRQKIKSEMDLKIAADSIQHMEAQKLSKAETEKEKQKNNFLFVGLGLTLLFGIFILNRFRVTSRQKKIIEKQKHQVDETLGELEEKQKEIRDSINYAQRLQQAILAPRNAISEVFPDSFLFYQPKDIVAGDFYFFEKTETHIFYAAADCTGHGVPGAMVSVVCSNALTRCVKEFELTDPGKILDKARELVGETFEKSGMDVKDGMDISLCVFKVQGSKFKAEGLENHKNATLNIAQITWAGANNPLWYIENGEIKEIKADKQPIGKTENPQPFTSHILSISISTLFLFTDGFADQFGGPKGKKFKYAPLQSLLLEASLKNNSSYPFTKIDIELHDRLNEWRGHLEQVDDITIIGINLNNHL